MRKTPHKAFTWSVATALVASTLLPAAQASIETDMADMFNSMGAVTSVQQSGAFRTQSANVYMGGALGARWGNKNMSLMNIQLPSASGGCGGIDLFGGSFSFANKEQFMAFVRNLGNNAAGVAFEIALDALDPLIGNSISKIRDLVNKVNGMNINSCETAKSLVAGTIGMSQQLLNSDCKANAAKDGTASDAADAKWYCQDDYNLMKQRLEALKDSRSGNDKNKPSVDFSGGNYTLIAMKNYNLSNDDKQWLMSIVGTVTQPIPAEGKQSQVPEPKYKDGTIKSLDQLFGADRSSNPPTTTTIRLLECKDDNGGVSYDPYNAITCDAVEKTIPNIRHMVAKRMDAFKTAISTNDRAKITDPSTLSMISSTSLPVVKMILADFVAQGKNSSTNSYLTQSMYDIMSYDFAYALLTNMRVQAVDIMNQGTARSMTEFNGYKRGIENLDNLRKELDLARSKAVDVAGKQMDLNRMLSDINDRLSKNLSILPSIYTGKQLAKQ